MIKPIKKYFGAWSDDYFPDGLNIYDYIDPNWDVTDINEIMNYITSARLVIVTPYPDFCPICRKAVSPGWRSDGTWLWTAAIDHLILSHKVKPPEELISHIRSVAYTPQDLFDLHALDWPFAIPK